MEDMTRQSHGSAKQFVHRHAANFRLLAKQTHSAD